MKEENRLSVIEARVKANLTREVSGSIDNAKLLYLARKELFSDGELWIAWAADKFDFSRRYCFTHLAVGKLLEEVAKCTNGALLQELELLPLRKLEELSVIPVHGLRTFMGKHDVKALSRDQLREIIRGKAARLPHLMSLLPKVEQLELFRCDAEAMQKLDHCKLGKSIGPLSNIVFESACNDKNATRRLLTLEAQFTAHHAVRERIAEFLRLNDHYKDEDIRRLMK